MILGEKRGCGGLLRQIGKSLALGRGSLLWLSLGVLACGFPALAQSQQPPIVPGAGSTLPDAPVAKASAGEQSPESQSPGSIGGTVVDRNGAAVAGASVKLTREGQTSSQEVLTGDDGRFSVANVAPGSFDLMITKTGFAAQAASGTLHPGENYTVPEIALVLATEITEVRVELSPIEIAQEQMKEEEKQRIFGVIPNFYVSYVPDAAPLTSKMKFRLAWKTTIDPVNFALNGVTAGIEQATNTYSGYGQGAQGYAKRYGAAYADFVTSTFIGNAILPSLLKQDPRYFYKGTGSKRSRALYAIANSVICKGDNGKWQANYSAILGGLAAGGISNLYYPANDRTGAGLAFENAAIGIGVTAAANLIQEFFLKKFTPNVPTYAPATP